MPWMVFITGMPGSGKSSIAKALVKLLDENKITAKYLPLDALRPAMVTCPSYNQEERDFVYKAYAGQALIVYTKGENVILDATAHRKKYRDLLRRQVDNFFEVYIKCSLEECVKREGQRKESLVMLQLYKKALLRKETGRDFPGLGQVIGVDVAYEENKEAELVLESDKISVNVAADKIFSIISSIS